MISDDNRMKREEQRGEMFMSEFGCDVRSPYHAFAFAFALAFGLWPNIA
jgi:hypothetical protein